MCKLRIFYYGINAFFFVAGIAFMGSGFALKKSWDQYAELMGSDSAPAMIIAMGFCIAGTAALGLVGVKKAQDAETAKLGKRLLFLYTIIMIIVVIIQLAAGAMIASYLGKLDGLGGKAPEKYADKVAAVADHAEKAKADGMEAVNNYLTCSYIFCCNINKWNDRKKGYLGLYTEDNKPSNDTVVLSCSDRTASPTDNGGAGIVREAKYSKVFCQGLVDQEVLTKDVCQPCNGPCEGTDPAEWAKVGVTGPLLYRDGLVEYLNSNIGGIGKAALAVAVIEIFTVLYSCYALFKQPKKEDSEDWDFDEPVYLPTYVVTYLPASHSSMYNQRGGRGGGGAADIEQPTGAVVAHHENSGV
jgi:hypothetical protein